MAVRRPTRDDETLADLLVRAQNRLGVSGGRALARAAAELGHEVSHTTLNKILADRAENQSTATIDAIAALSGVPRARAHVAAGQPAPGRPFAEELPPEADRLDRRQRDAVLGVIRVLLDRDVEPRRGRRAAPPLTAAVARKSSTKGRAATATPAKKAAAKSTARKTTAKKAATKKPAAKKSAAKKSTRR